jgi:hypothetical protein
MKSTFKDHLMGKKLFGISKTDFSDVRPSTTTTYLRFYNWLIK